jgi:hypothetical protein
MKQQTALQYLIQEIKKHAWIDEDGFEQVSLSILDLEKAKELEKEQIEKSFIDGKFHELYGLNITEEKRAEKYYEETYTQSSE